MINDETLTLYFYGDELDPQERDRIAAELARDAALAARYADLERDLIALRTIEASSAPAESVVRWRYELDKVVDAEASRRTPAPWVWLFSAAAVLILGIAIGLNLSTAPRQDQTPQTADIAIPDEAHSPPASTSPPLALTRGLTAHLQETRLQLVSLTDTSADDRIELITSIIEQNRLFERAAEANAAPELARVLRAFEQMLVELAREEAAPQDISDKTNQLSFEYAVMLTKLTQDASQKATSL